MFFCFTHQSFFSPTPPAGSPNEVHAEIVANHTRIVPWSCSATNGCPGKGWKLGSMVMGSMG